MIKFLKYFLVVVSLTGLAACDNADKEAKGNEAEKPAATQSSSDTQNTTADANANDANAEKKVEAEPAAPAATATDGDEVSVLDGKVSLSLPKNFKEQPGGSDMMKMYADMEKQHTLLVISTPAVGGAEMMKDHVKAALDMLKAQHPDLQVVKEGEVQAGNLKMQQMTVKMTAGGQAAYSYTALGVVGDKQLTLQFTAPVAEEKDFQNSVDQILNSVKVK